MSDASAVVAALRTAQDAFAGIAAALDADAIRSRSACREWSVAQVASHLGSGAELAIDWLRAAIDHADPAGAEQMQVVWDAWNSRTPDRQVADAVEMSAAHVAALERASPEQLTQAYIELFGVLKVDGVGLALLRLPELVIHTWDIAVVRDPSARLLPAAVDLIMEDLPARAGLFGRPQPRGWTLTVETDAPKRRFTLWTADTVRLEAGTTADADGILRLSADALILLLYGRVGAGDAMAITLESDRVGLADLRAAFPGV